MELLYKSYNTKSLEEFGTHIEVSEIRIRQRLCHRNNFNRFINGTLASTQSRLP